MPSIIGTLFTLVFYGIIAVLAVIVAILIVRALFAVGHWFATAPIPEPRYDSSVRAPRSFTPQLIAGVILLTWLALNVIQVVQSGRFF